MGLAGGLLHVYFTSTTTEVPSRSIAVAMIFPSMDPPPIRPQGRKLSHRIDLLEMVARQGQPDGRGRDQRDGIRDREALTTDVSRGGDRCDCRLYHHCR
jgi:hypothetical protein